MMQLVNSLTNEVLLPHIEVANTLWQRFRGLMFHSQLPQNYGLWIEPCSSVHTMWMRMPIDIYFISREGSVLEFREQVVPWKTSIPKSRARCVLEIANPTLKIALGTQVHLQEPCQ